MPWKLLSVLVILLATGALASAEQPLSNPTGRVVLVIEGDVSNKNGATGASFDMAMLKRLTSHTIKTETPWTEGTQTFEGPLMIDLLKAAGATGTTIRAVAINDYAVNIPILDFEKYPAILAHTLNGKAMLVRGKGPLWIIYPWSDSAEIRNETYYAKSIWQVKMLVVK